VKTVQERLAEAQLILAGLLKVNATPEEIVKTMNAMIDDAVEHEREACALIADEQADDLASRMTDADWKAHPCRTRERERSGMSGKQIAWAIFMIIAGKVFSCWAFGISLDATINATFDACSGVICAWWATVLFPESNIKAAAKEIGS
jgi:hypothetical protein